MTARILPLTGVENFRDYGDYAGRGGRVAAGRLYRSAHHGKATSEDLAVIGGLGLAAVVDLRRPMERDAEPTPRGRRAEAGARQGRGQCAPPGRQAQPGPPALKPARGTRWVPRRSG